MSNDKLVNDHWRYIFGLLSRYNKKHGIVDDDLDVLEQDYKRYMHAGLNGEELPPVERKPVCEFDVYNMTTAYIHGKKHREQGR